MTSRGNPSVEEAKRRTREHGILKTQRDIADRLQRERGIIVPWVFFRVTKRKVEPIKRYTTGWNNARQRVGFPELIAMGLSGHKTRSIFLRYDIVDDKDLKVGVEQLANFHGQAEYGTNYGTITTLAMKVKGNECVRG